MKYNFHLVIESEEEKIFDIAYQTDSIEPMIEDLQLFSNRLKKEVIQRTGE